MIARHKALALLSECTGETIWPVDYCVQRGIPQTWIDQLADAIESGFEQDRDTIYPDQVAYLERQPTNQFHGIRDVDLAVQLGQILGVDVERLRRITLGRSALVAAIKESVMDGE